MSLELEAKLVIPGSLDLDIKRRLKLEEIIKFLSSLDLTTVQDAASVRYLIDNPQRFQSGWTMTEVNYLLYGTEKSEGLVCTDGQFHYYNFFNYIDMNNPEDRTRKDICEAERGIATHVHALVHNPQASEIDGEKFLGTLHNHPYFGFSSRKRMNKVDAVGFSSDDEWWNNWYLDRYGIDGRKLAFVVYYSDNDFYMGVVRTKHTQPILLDIIVK